MFEQFVNPPTGENKRSEPPMNAHTLHIRLAQQEDAAAILKIYAPYIRDTVITYEYEVPTVAEFTRRMEEVMEKYPWLVAEEAGEIVGYAYLSSFHHRAAVAWCAETSIYLAPKAKGKGLGRRLYEALERCATAQGILNLNASIAVPQGEEDEHLTWDSVRFHQHMGYRMVGSFQSCAYKFGTWYGLCWMEKLIGPHESPVAPWRPFAQVKDQVELL
jgi:phosphinothricin acetyltransferase